MPRKTKMHAFESAETVSRQESVPGPSSSADEIKRKKLEAQNKRVRKLMETHIEKRAAKKQAEASALAAQTKAEDEERLSDLRELQALSGYKKEKTSAEARAEEYDAIEDELERTKDLRELQALSGYKKEKTPEQQRAEDFEWAERIREDIENQSRARETEAKKLQDARHFEVDEKILDQINEQIASKEISVEEPIKKQESEAAGAQIVERVQKEKVKRKAEDDPLLKREVAKLKKLEKEQTEIADRLESITGMSPDDAYEKLVLNAGFMGRIKRGLAKLANVPTYKLLEQWLELGKKIEESSSYIQGVKPDAMQTVKGKYLRAGGAERGEEVAEAAIGRELAREYSAQHGPLTEESLGLDEAIESAPVTAAPEQVLTKEEIKDVKRLDDMFYGMLGMEGEVENSTDDQLLESLSDLEDRLAEYEKGVENVISKHLDSTNEELGDAAVKADNQLKALKAAFQKRRASLQQQIRGAGKGKRTMGVVLAPGRSSGGTSFGAGAMDRRAVVSRRAEGSEVSEEEWQAKLDKYRSEYEASQQAIRAQEEAAKAIATEDVEAPVEAVMEESSELSEDEQIEQAASDFKKGIVRDAEGNIITDEKKIKARRPRSRVPARLPTSGSSTERAIQKATPVELYERPEPSTEDPRQAFQRERANEIRKVREQYPKAAEVWNEATAKLQGLDDEELGVLKGIFGTIDIATAYTLDRAAFELDNANQDAKARLEKADAILNPKQEDGSVIIDPEYLKEVKALKKKSKSNKNAA